MKETVTTALTDKSNVYWVFWHFLLVCISLGHFATRLILKYNSIMDEKYIHT